MADELRWSAPTVSRLADDTAIMPAAQRHYRWLLAAISAATGLFGLRLAIVATPTDVIPWPDRGSAAGVPVIRDEGEGRSRGRVNGPWPAALC